MVEINTVSYDPVDYLLTPDNVREYLQAALDEGDADYFIQALADAGRSQGMCQLLEASKIKDKTLFTHIERV